MFVKNFVFVFFISLANDVDVFGCGRGCGFELYMKSNYLFHFLLQFSFELDDFLLLVLQFRLFSNILLILLKLETRILHNLTPTLSMFPLISNSYIILRSSGSSVYYDTFNMIWRKG